MALKFHKDYGEDEFAYDQIVRAWSAINGANSEGRYFFIGHLERALSDGQFMAYLIRPDKASDGKDNLIVPFNYEGFQEDADADQAIYKRVYEDLGWRIREIEKSFLPK